jgi:hypothetical protein
MRIERIRYRYHIRHTASDRYIKLLFNGQTTFGTGIGTGAERSTDELFLLPIPERSHKKDRYRYKVGAKTNWYLYWYQRDHKKNSGIDKKIGAQTNYS